MQCSAYRLRYGCDENKRIDEMTFQVKAAGAKVINKNCTYSYPLRYAQYRMRYRLIDGVALRTPALIAVGFGVRLSYQ